MAEIAKVMVGASGGKAMCLSDEPRLLLWCEDRLAHGAGLPRPLRFLAAEAGSSVGSTPPADGLAAPSTAISTSSTASRRPTKAQRANILWAAQRRRRHGSEPPGNLRRMAVTPATLLRYKAADAAFAAWCRERRLPLTTTPEHDAARNTYVEALYDSGEGISSACYAVYSMSFLLDLPKVATLLPLVKKALVGFGKSGPALSRDPPPLEAGWLICNAVARDAAPWAAHAAAAWLLSFDTQGPVRRV